MIHVSGIALVERVLVKRDEPTLWMNPRAYVLFLDWDGRSSLDAALDSELVANLCGGVRGEPFSMDVQMVDPAGRSQMVLSSTAPWPADRTMQFAVDLRRHRLRFEQHGLHRFELNCNGALAAAVSIPVFGLEAESEPELR